MRDILEIICKRFPEIVWIAVGVFAVVMVGTYFATPQYVSEARILVPIGRESTVPATALTQPLNVFINRAEQIQTQIEILHSRNLFESTIDSLSQNMLTPQPPAGVLGHIRFYLGRGAALVGSGLRYTLEFLGLLPKMTDKERIVLDCQERFSAKRQKETELIIIGFRHPSPQFAQAFLQQFLDNYVREKTLTNAGTTAPFFAEQQRELESKLVDSRAALAAFRTEWGILDLDVQREQLVREFGRLITAINENKAELGQVNFALNKLKSTGGQDEPESLLPGTLRQDPGIVENLRNLAALRSRESHQGAEIGGNHPERGNVKKEIVLLRASIRAEGIRLLQNRQTALESLVQDLESQREALQADVRTLDAKGREMRSLETSVDVLEKALVQYGEKRETSRVADAMDERKINAIRVVEAPNLAYRPESPKPLRNLILGVIFGILAGLSYAFASNYLSSTVNTLEDVKSCFPEAVAVYIPDVLHNNMQSMRSRLLAPMEALLRLKNRGRAAPLPTILSGAEAAQPAEAKLSDPVLTMLIRRFFYCGSERRFPASLLLTGTGRGVGVSFLARSIARHLSRIYGMRILLVQLDSSSAASGQSNGPTFAGWLHGEEAPGAAGGNGVTEMSSGVRDASADAVLFAMGSGRLADLKQDYDMLLFDSAPVAWDSAAVHVASLVDKVVVVAVAEQTRKQVLADTAAGLVQTGAEVLGVICNRRRFYIPNWLYAMLG